MNINEQTVGVARRTVFFALVQKEGEIKRGVLEARMHVSPATFYHEYKSWMDFYPNIKYDKKTRTFKYEP